MTLVDQIREMISAGETEKSLEELYKFVKENNADIIDSLVMLRSRMQSVERAVSVGTMSSQEAALEKAKINDAILKLLPQLTPEYLAEASKRKTTASAASTAYRPVAPAKNNNKVFLIIGGVAIFLLLMIWAMSSGDSETTNDLTQETQQLVEPEPGGNNAQQFAEPEPDGQAQPAATLLDELLAKRGTATWQATVAYLGEDENTLCSFVFQDNTTCSIYAEGNKEGTCTVVENTTEYVTIYLSEGGTGVYFRIYETIAKVGNEDQSEWKIIYEGAWK